MQKTRIFAEILLISGASLCPPIASAVIDTAQPYTPSNFIYDPNKLNPSLNLSVTDKTENVTISEPVLKARLKKFEKDTRIEGLSVKLPASPKDLATFVRHYARAQKTSELFDYLSEKFYKTQSNVRADHTKKVTLDVEALELFDLERLAQIYSKPHHNVHLTADVLKANHSLSVALMQQLRYFLPTEQRSQILQKIRSGLDISLEKDLLPNFAARVVRKFLAFKGPNCFHAALAFHGEDLTRSQFINVKSEDGYHRAMINYDELWRAIKAGFYEVNVDKSPLKYGDMLVFFELPKEGAAEINYRWIRHAATYLIGPYTFSKGSKSPDTPYTIKNLQEEWSTWRGMTKNLGVKVFRRSSKHATKAPPVELVDWLY